ncbi:MAG TPA: FHA domain-containing protein [Drouetiella sp.]
MVDVASSENTAKASDKKDPKAHDNAQALSQHATKPGDSDALKSQQEQAEAQRAQQQKLQEAGLLPKLAIDQSPKQPTDTARTQNGDTTPPAADAKPAQPRPAALDQKTLEETAKELHDAINQTSWLGLKSNPDANKIMQLLGPLGAADRATLEKVYHDKYDANGGADSLRRDLKSKLGDYDFRHSEAALNAPDGRTNDAGALMTAIAHAHDDKDRGNAEIRAVLQTLNTKQLAQLDEDFKKQYGKSYVDALNENGDLTKATKDALPLLEKGVDKRTSEDLQKLAHIAVDNGDPRLFSEAIRGDSPEAVAARKAILADENFKNQIAEKFPSPAVQSGVDTTGMSFDQKADPVALDYLQEGRISLATIAKQDTGKWIFDNKDNLELAAKNASPKERQDYAAGRDLAESGNAPANDQEKQQLDYYNKIHAALKNGGNDREVSIWEDELIHGRETLISQLAKTHSDGWAFGLGSGTNKNDLMTAVENMSKDDWTLLKGPDGAKYRKELQESLSTYADPTERARVEAMLNEKLSKDSYEDAAKVHRNLQDTIADNKGHVFLGMGTSYDGKNILQKFTNMSAEDAAKYKNDPEFKKQLDQFINDNLKDNEKLLANRMLKQVETTGQPPKPDAVDTVISDSVNGAKSQKLLADAEKALQDPELRARLNKPDDQLSEDDRRVKNIIKDAIASASGYADDGSGVVNTDKYSKALFETGHLTAQQKAELGFDKKDLLPAIAAAPEAERAEAMKNLSSDEQQVVNSIAANPDHKPDLADRIRSMAIGSGGDPADFKDELGKLSFADRQALKEEYTRKYGKDLDQDFLDKCKDSDKSTFTNLLKPSESDGRQNYYDNYHRMLESESGFSADGSKLTLEKANDMYAASLEEYQKVYKTLPAEKQKALDEYFGSALEQYKSSKEKLAEIVVDATITAAALAAAPFTGGASLALVISIAAASGAAFRLAAMKAIEGNDFDGSAKNIVKQIVIGGTSAALNFVGGGAVEGLAANVSGKVITDVAATAGKDILSTAGKEALEKGLPKLLENGGKRLTEEEVGALVAKAAPNATAAEKEALEKAITAKVGEIYPQEQARLAEEVANRTRAAAAKEFGKEIVTNAAIGAGSNVASEVVVAPFNEHGIDWDNLKSGTLTGLVVGAVMPVALRGALHVVGGAKTIITNITRDAEGLSINPANIKEPVTFRNTKTGEVRTIEPNKGEPLKLTKDWQPEAGGEKVSGDTKFTDAHGKPVAPEMLGDLNTVSGARNYSNYDLEFNGKKVSINKPSIVLGRNESSDVINPLNTVSGRHAEIRFTEEGARVRDLNSTNGTYVNGRKLNPGEEVALNPGDKVSLGKNGPEYKFGVKPEAVEVRPVMEYRPGAGGRDVAANPEAVRQSNAYKDQGDIREKLQDGFQTVGGDTRVGRDGNWNDPNRPGVVIDRTQDEALRDTIAEAHARFDRYRNDPKRLAEELAKFSKEKMEPKGWNGQQIDDSYMAFRADNANKRILLGDYIERAKLGEGAGVCQHQALLMKVLGDEMGLDISLTGGYLGNVGKNNIPKGFHPNHAWNELHVNGETLIYDPRNSKFGVRAEKLPQWTPIRDFGRGENAVVTPERFNVKPGDQVSHQGNNWKITNETPSTPGNLVLRANGSRPVAPRDLEVLNPGHPPKVGDSYQVKRTNGQIEDGWVMTGINRDGTIELHKTDAIRTEVSPRDLAAENPQIARALGRNNVVLSGGNDLTAVQKDLNAIQTRLAKSRMSADQQTELMDALKAHLQTADASQFKELARKMGQIPDIADKANALKTLLELSTKNPEISFSLALRSNLPVKDLNAYAHVAEALEHVQSVPAGLRENLQGRLNEQLAHYNLKEATSDFGTIRELRNQSENLSDVIDGFARNSNVSETTQKNVLSLLDMGNDKGIRLAFGQIMAKNADERAVQMYTDLTKQSLLIDIPASSSKGHIAEYEGFSRLRDASAENRLTDGWVFVPSTNGSVADSAGIDGAFINVKTREYVPVDLALDPNTVAKKIGERKGQWAFAIQPNEYSTYGDNALANRVNQFLSPRGLDSVQPPHVSLDTFAGYGNGSAPVPEFRKVLTQKEADAIAKDELRPVSTTPKAIDKLQNQIDAATIPSAERRNFFNLIRDRAGASRIPREIEEEVSEQILARMGNAVDARPGIVRSEYPSRMKVGDDYIEIPRTSGSGDVVAVRVYKNGNLVGVQKDPTKTVSLGSLKGYMERARQFTALDPATAASLTDSTSLNFDFNSSTSKAEIFKKYPAIEVLSQALENGPKVKLAATDAHAVVAAKAQIQSAMALDKSLQQLSDDQINALAKDTVAVRKELKNPALTPAQVRDMQTIRELAPNSVSWAEADAARQLMETTKVSATDALFTVRMKAANPNIKPETIENLKLGMEIMDADKLDADLARAVARHLGNGTAEAALDGLDLFIELYKRQGGRFNDALLQERYADLYDQVRNCGINEKASMEWALRSA